MISSGVAIGQLLPELVEDAGRLVAVAAVRAWGSVPGTVLPVADGGLDGDQGAVGWDVSVRGPVDDLDQALSAVFGLKRLQGAVMARTEAFDVECLTKMLNWGGVRHHHLGLLGTSVAVRG